MGIFILSIFSIFNDDHIKHYLKSANLLNEVKYNFVSPINCKSGPRSESYVFAPTGVVFLKQVSNDGTVGETCD